MSRAGTPVSRLLRPRRYHLQDLRAVAAPDLTRSEYKTRPDPSSSETDSMAPQEIEDSSTGSVMSADTVDRNSAWKANPQNSPQIWQPYHGIVFSPPRSPGASSPVSMLDSRGPPPTAIRATRTVSSPAVSLTRDAPLLTRTTSSVNPHPGNAALHARTSSTKASATSDGSESSDVKAAKPANGVVESLRGLLASLAVGGKGDSSPGDAKADSDTEAGASEKPQEYWTYVRHGKTTGKTPELCVCDTLASADEAVGRLLGESLIGFDLEWVSNSRSDMDPKRRVSLIQVAGWDLIVLVQVARFEGDELMPANLRTLLEDPEVRKVGVNIRGDCNRVRESFAVDTDGIFELSQLHRVVKYSGGDAASRKQLNRRLVGLSAQCEEHLGLPLWKEQFVRSGDWTRELSPEQRQYAGSDAYAGLVLFQELEKKRLAMDPVPDLPGPLEFTTPLGRPVVAEEEEEEKPAGDAKKAITPKTRKKTAVASAASDDDSDDDSEDDGIVYDDESSEDESAEDEDTDVEDFRDAEPEPPVAVPAAAAPDQALLDAATAFAQSTRAALITARDSAAAKPGIAHLRAYYLWHEYDMEVKEAAAKLGIKPGSAAGYVLEAIMVGRLEHEPRRTVAAAKLVPVKVLRARYIGFLKRVTEEAERNEKRA